MIYLDFKTAKCKDCYKCLRECPVKAIKIENHQAKIIESRCILCGKCTRVCPQNAKRVHSDIDSVKKLVKSGKAVASVAPSFVSSFGLESFAPMEKALKELGFVFVEETAVGARAITEEYRAMLKTGKYKNLISSACPAVNKLIELYYPEVLPYLAPCDTPMAAHAKMLKKRFTGHKVVFIGPCIAKKREADEGGIVDGVLTFEDLSRYLADKNIQIDKTAEFCEIEGGCEKNSARTYPINRGIIKSFEGYVEGYEFVAVDGVEKCKEVFENIGSLDHMFLELNACDYACVNGPCSLIEEGTAVKANATIRKYALTDGGEPTALPEGLDYSHTHRKGYPEGKQPTEKDIEHILAQTGKTSPELELNCGACGYETCREKAWAVANGFADIEMCVPYMRERAESMNYEVTQNSPNGILIVNADYNIVEINGKAMRMLGIKDTFVKGKSILDFYDAADILLAFAEERNVFRKKAHVENTGKYVELNVKYLKKQNVVLAVMKDITDMVNYDEKLNAVKIETLTTTDEVIKKQMRVAQEIASLLGETTAETKVALLKLKQTLLDEQKGDE